MEPITAGVLSNIAYKSLTNGAGILREKTFRDRVENAAKQTSKSYPSLSQDHFLLAVKGSGIDPSATAVLSSQKEHIVTELQEIISNQVEVDAEKAIVDFLWNVESELADSPEIWRRIAIQYLQGISSKGKSVENHILDLKEEIKSFGDSFPGFLPGAIKAIQQQGFRWLTDDFLHEQPVDSEKCWHRPFTFTEVVEGYAISRKHSSGNGLSEHVLSQLTNGNIAIVGEPGTGKTTICKQVALNWHFESELGPVLYRESGTGKPIDSIADLDTVVDFAHSEGRVLVVIEDAARPDTVQWLEFLEQSSMADKTSILIDSRKSEWDQLPSLVQNSPGIDPKSTHWQRIFSQYQSLIKEIEVPCLKRRDIKAFRRRFIESTDFDSSLVPSVSELESRLQADQFGMGQSVQANTMVMLSYELATATASDNTGDSLALKQSVANVAAEVDSQNKDSPLADDLVYRLGVGVNILNASGLPVRIEWLLGLADSIRSRHEIERALDNLRGVLYFGDRNDSVLRPHHELWSALYLITLLDGKNERVVRAQFEKTVNSILEFFTNSEKREETLNWFGEETDTFEQQGSVDFQAYSFLYSVFNLGRKYPRLAPLYGSSSTSKLRSPSELDSYFEQYTAIWRAEINLFAGNLEQAKYELESVTNEAEIASSADKIMLADQTYVFGCTLRQKGKYIEAQETLERARDLYEQAQTPLGVGKTINELGLVSLRLNDFHQAKSFFLKSFYMFKDIDNTGGMGDAIGNLGLVAEYTDSLTKARECHLKGLGLSRKAGNRRGELESLENLGDIAVQQGNYTEAKRAYNKVVTLTTDMGLERARLKAKEGLARVAVKEGKPDEAQSILEEVLKGKQDFGNQREVADTINNIGIAAFHAEEYGVAIDLLNEAIQFREEIGHKQGVVDSLINLASAYSGTSYEEKGRELLQDALRRATELKYVQGIAGSLASLSNYDSESGRYNTAIVKLEKAKEIFDQHGPLDSYIGSLVRLSQLYSKIGEIDISRDYTQQANSVADGTDITGPDDLPVYYSED